MESRSSTVETVARILGYLCIGASIIFFILFAVDAIEWLTAPPNKGVYGNSYYKSLEMEWLFFTMGSLAGAFQCFVITKILEYLRGILFYNQSYTFYDFHGHRLPCVFMPPMYPFFFIFY